MPTGGKKANPSVLTTLLSIFGCPHTRTTFPRCRKDATGQPQAPLQHYVVCLDCGREIDHTLFDHPAASPRPAMRNRQAA